MGYRICAHVPRSRHLPHSSVYNAFAAFLKWRKGQPAFMQGNTMSDVSGDAHQIIFDRTSETQTLRCCFDFKTLTATFEEVK